MLRPVPVGRWRRLTLLGSLQAKIAAAYLFYWVRGFFRSDAEKARLLEETHWRTAADGILVPRVYPQYSTARILTMERLAGVHLDQYLARGPSQDERNAMALRMIRAWYRLMFAGRMLYNDFHPGNFLFQDDGRLGLIDFGYVLTLDDELWELFRIIDRPLTTGRREDRIAAMKAWSGLTDETSDQMRLYDAFSEWNWCARAENVAVDFGDEAEFRRGVDLFLEMVRKRYSRGHRTTQSIARGNFGWRSLLYRLGAKIDVAPIAEEEVLATGWDRSEYARSRHAPS
jgi:hypothetical protein